MYNSDKDNLPDSSSIKQEYIEIYNTGDNAVDLTGWSLNTQKPEILYRMPSCILPAKAYLIIAYPEKQNNDFYPGNLLSEEETELSLRKIFYADKSLMNDSEINLLLKDADEIIRDRISYIMKEELTLKNLDSDDNNIQPIRFSLQRIFSFNDAENQKNSEEEWIVDVPTPFGQNEAFIDTKSAATSRIIFTYDMAGNRKSRTIVLASPVMEETEEIEDEENIAAIVEEQEAGGTVIIYPNPTKGQLTVEFKGYNNNFSGNICLYTIKGNTIISETIRAEKVYLELSDYPQGVYLLKTDINGQVSTWKIIKE